MKVVFWVLGSLLALVVGLMPEVALYFLYGVINPQTELTRVITVLSFLFLGGGACFGFGILGLALFAGVTKAVLE